jgi:alpha-L-fucosidase 2
MKKFILTLCVTVCAMPGFVAAQQQQHYRLWYTQPADEWMKSVPLGNGRIGAMVFGGVQQETIALNEITMWSGQPDEFQERPLGRDMLEGIRKLFFEGNVAEGNRIAEQFMAGTPHSFGSHVPLGDLKMTFRYPTGEVTGYHRELDLATATTTVGFRVGGVTFTREAFCSNPDDVLVVRLFASRSRALNFTLSLSLLREAVVAASEGGMEFSGQALFPRQGPGGVNFAGNVSVRVTDGKVSAQDDGVVIEGASEVIVAVDIRTDFTGGDYRAKSAETVNRTLAQDYNTLKTRHTKDHAALYNRVDLSLGAGGRDDIPTDKRWERAKTGVADPWLDALFFQYARYLQIAASRANSPLPANLQGLWNDNLACNMGWTNDYHLDINTQQNYWLANVGNLHETNAPLFDYLDRLAVDGQKTARNVYGARGWAANTVANVWGYTASGGGVGWGLFPMAGVWLSTHLWTHYEYTRDVDFLRERAYPILKANVKFLADYMTTDPRTGYLVTGPSTSPENSFRWGGREFSLSMMPTSDRRSEEHTSELQ